MFSIQQGYTGREAIAIIIASKSLGLDYRLCKKPIPDSIPIGTVEFCSLLYSGKVDFFPNFLYHRIKREHYFVEGSAILSNDLYVKDLTGWKTGFETKKYSKGYKLPDGKWFLSQDAHFKNEWRLYVADGKVITHGWYRGEQEDLDFPTEIDFPKGFSGAVDFGMGDQGLELIESHAPFACGWYGETHVDYVHWQYKAWNCMNYYEEKL